MENEEIAQLDAHFQNEVKSIKGEVARLADLLAQVLSVKNGKRTSAQPLIEALLVRVPHKKK
jgi:hypothetical protein